MSITCKLGRSFISLEAVQECAKNHGGCEKHSAPEYSAPSRHTGQPTELTVIMLDCPLCTNNGVKLSAWYNKAVQKYECFKCKRSGRTLEELSKQPQIIGLNWTPREDRDITVNRAGLTNPMLISIKMFLADIRMWRNKYRDGEYVCTDFSREVVQHATDRSMRCGFVNIYFEKNPVGHALVAFQTDHGLVYIEPQTGEEVDVILGRRYPWVSEGISENDPIRYIDIEWNDDTRTVFE